MTMPPRGLEPVIPTSAAGLYLEPGQQTDLIPADDQVHGTLTVGKPRSMLARGWEVFAENKLALVGVGIVIFFILFSFVGPLIYHTDQTSVPLSLATYLKPPSAQHLLGTDDVGFDQLGRLMAGGQSIIEVSLAAAFVACIFGSLYGAFSGFMGGFTDTALMRIVDAGLSIPYLFILIILSVIFHPNPLTMIAFISIIYWFGVARLIRGETLSLRTREYVQAVRVAGGRNSRAIVRHIMPNAIGTIIVQTTFAVADSIAILAFLGFLGYGIQPPATDWGSMLSNGLTYVNGGDWWLIYPPGICIILMVVAWNFIGDALRDAFETRLQRR
jgi:peptide/nickel transport system permease protein